MKKSHLEELTDEVELARQGIIQYVPDPSEVIVRDPKNFEKRINELRCLNGLPPRKIELDVLEKKPASQVTIRVSKSAYTRLASKAKREKLSVGRYVENLSEK